MSETSQNTNKTKTFSIPEQNQRKLISQIQKKVFQFAGVEDRVTKNQIPCSQNQTVSSYFIKSTKQMDVNIYVSHGFGGTSLMFFPILENILQKGNVVLWEIRGMGIGVKKVYDKIALDQINDFYVEGFKSVINFYDHKNIVLLCHSLSGYIAMRYLIQQPEQNKIKKAILLSPIGFTSKKKDDKNQIKNFEALKHSLINRFGWRFKLTFKSPMRTILKCVKRKILTDAFKEFNLSKQQLQLMVDLFLTLVDLPDGSEDIFFDYFLPRVLPRDGESISQLIEPGEIQKNISIYYGGPDDWVDIKGAKCLARQNANVSLKILQNCGHMICLNANQMKFLIKQQFE